MVAHPRAVSGAKSAPARHAGPRRRPDTRGAEGAGHSGERRWIGWKDPRPDRLGEDEHPRMPDPGGEPSPGREPEVAVQVAEVAQDPGAAAEDLDLLILEVRHLAFQPAPLPLDHAQVPEGRKTPLDDRAAGAGHLHDRAPQLGDL